MRRLIFLTTCLASMAMAEPPPPVPDGGLRHYHQEACTDPETGLDGTCYHSHDIHQNRYIAFYVDELAWVIWQVKDGQKVEIWRRGADV